MFSSRKDPTLKTDTSTDAVDIGIWEVLEGAQFFVPSKTVILKLERRKLGFRQSRLWPSRPPSWSPPWCWSWWWWRCFWHLAVAAVNLWQIFLNWVTFNLGTWLLPMYQVPATPYPVKPFFNKENVVKPKSNCWYFSLRSVHETKARALFWLWSFK